MSVELWKAIIQLATSVMFVVIAWQVVSIYREMSKLLAVIRSQGRMIYMLHVNVLTALDKLDLDYVFNKQAEEMAKELKKIKDLLD